MSSSGYSGVATGVAAGSSGYFGAIGVSGYYTIGYTPLFDTPEYKKLIKMGYKPVTIYSSKFGKFLDEHFPKISNILKIKKIKSKHILKKGRIKVICYFIESYSCEEHNGYYTFRTSISTLNEVLKWIIQLEREEKLKRLLKNNI